MGEAANVRTLNIFNIPAGEDMAAALAAALLAETKDDPLALSAYRLLLPTRRACRAVREAFVACCAGQALLLPRLQTLGDVEEDELSLLAGVEADVPPALSPIARQVLLARLVAKMPQYRAQGPVLALDLAGALGHLLDQIQTEGLDLKNLPGLVAAERFAAHWGLTIDFLKILSEAWPLILAERGLVDLTTRRNALMTALADQWRRTPPAGPVIAAGSTGSIPTTAALLGVIAALPRGRLVLPGLDQGIDAESWAGLEETHPQATLRSLLQFLGVARDDVKPWPLVPGEGVADEKSLKRKLAAEIMRPAATAAAWTVIPDRLAAAEKKMLHSMLQNNLIRHDCTGPEEEARVIALTLRHVLETPGRTAALVTPDRDLARRVAATCRRWGLEIDDSAGQKLTDTAPGVFLHLVAEVVRSRVAPGDLLALLRHPLCRGGRVGIEGGTVQDLDKLFLRGPRPGPGFEGLGLRVQERVLERPRPGRAEAAAKVEELLRTLAAAFAPLSTLHAAGAAQGLADWLTAHIQVTEALSGADILWSGAAGEEAAAFLSRLAADPDIGRDMEPLTLEEYSGVLNVLMKTVTVRPRYGTHPRLMILGQLEARMIQTDVMVLGGLNEGVWPAAPAIDPWLSRPMRVDFGLPPPERGIGLAAHDFVQGFCAPRTVLTRAVRREGKPGIPSRWLQRMDVVLAALGMTGAGDDGTRHLAGALDVNRALVFQPRPAPCPPLSLRPRTLPVTQIEMLLSNPYAVYAKYVLNLRPLDALDKPPDAAARGQFLHDVLNDFVKAWPAALPPDAAQILIDRGLIRKSRMATDSALWDYWWPRFERLAHAFIKHERAWRAGGAAPLVQEVEGTLSWTTKALRPFTLSARADRIDRAAGGGLALIDYKSGGEFSVKKMQDGRLSQLPLEAVIAAAGSFGDGVGGAATYAAYWTLTGAVEEMKITKLDGADLNAAVAAADAGVRTVIDAYEDDTMPYHCYPDPARQPRHDDYEHLARRKEWDVRAQKAGTG